MKYIIRQWIIRYLCVCVIQCLSEHSCLTYLCHFHSLPFLSCLCHCAHCCQVYIAEHFSSILSCLLSCEYAVLCNIVCVLKLQFSASVGIEERERDCEIFIQKGDFAILTSTLSVIILKNQIINKTDELCCQQHNNHQQLFLQALTFPRDLQKICSGLLIAFPMGFFSPPIFLCYSS